MFRMSIGEGVIEDFAEIQSFGSVPTLLDPAAGIGKNTDVDAVLIHDVEIFPVIESVKAHPSDISFRFGHKLEKLTRKRVKMSIDDHGLSSLYRSAQIDYLDYSGFPMKNYSPQRH
jgi:hypothetical protein